jgi:hypothetical protein
VVVTGARAIAVVVAVTACSGGKAKAVDDARRVGPGDADRRDAGGSGTGSDAAAVGDALVRVVWPDVPIAARASPGRTACGTPRAPAVEPTTLWGIPDVFVMIAVPGPVPSPRLVPRVVYERCTLAPRVAVAGEALVLASASEAPARLALERVGELRALAAARQPGVTREILLPAVGHEVELRLEPGAVYALAASGAPAAEAESAFVVAQTGARLAVTGSAGQVTVRELPIGTHAVTAWLPPRAGHASRLASGHVTVEAGALAEITLDLSAP